MALIPYREKMRRKRQRLRGRRWGTGDPPGEPLRALLPHPEVRTRGPLPGGSVPETLSGSVLWATPARHAAGWPTQKESPHLTRTALLVQTA